MQGGLGQELWELLQEQKSFCPKAGKGPGSIQPNALKGGLISRRTHTAD